MVNKIQLLRYILLSLIVIYILYNIYGWYVCVPVGYQP